MANISHFTQTVNGVSTTYDIHDANAIPKIGSNQISGDLIPSSDGTVNLGSSSKKFASLNGIAPDELGLPTSTYTDVSSYITNLDGVTPNGFTAPASGILYFEGNNATVLYNLFYVNSVPIDNSSYRCAIPVTKGDDVMIWTRASRLDNIRIYHLKGKV